MFNLNFLKKIFIQNFVKYFKPYKRHKFQKPKEKNEQEVKQAEEEHTRKENHQEQLHEEATTLLTYLREKESLLTTEHKETTDKIHQVLKEKGEERRKSKDEKFELLKQQYEEEKEGRKRLIENAADVSAYLKKVTAADEALIGLFQDYFESKKQKM